MPHNTNLLTVRQSETDRQTDRQTKTDRVIVTRMMTQQAVHLSHHPLHQQLLNMHI